MLIPRNTIYDRREKKGRRAFLREDKLMVEEREVNLKDCKKNSGELRSEDRQGEGREEIVTTAERQKWIHMNREKQKSDELSGKKGQAAEMRLGMECDIKVQESAGSSRRRKCEETEQTPHECQPSSEINDRLMMTRQFNRSRSYSGVNIVNVKGSQKEKHSDILLSGRSAQNRNTRNKGTESNFYNLRNWVRN